MPQVRALGRTTAGRTNRSLAPPRLPDGTWADAQQQSPRAQTHRQRLEQIPPPPPPPPARVAADDFVRNAVPALPAPLSLRLARTHALTAVAGLPRATLASSRSFPPRNGGIGNGGAGAGGDEAALDPRPQETPWPYQPRTARQKTEEQQTAALTAIAAPKLAPYASVNMRVPLTKSPRAAAAATHAASANAGAAAGVDEKSSHPIPAATFADGRDVLEAALRPCGPEDAATPTGVFFPSSSSNFGEGSGVAGTRGQRFVNKKGVADFLAKLANANKGGGGGGRDTTTKPSLSPAELHTHSLSSAAHFTAKVNLSFSNIRPETPTCALVYPPSTAATAAASARSSTSGSQSHRQNNNNNHSTSWDGRRKDEAERQRAAAAAAASTAAQAARAHDEDMRVVRLALQKLGAAAGSLNGRQWFKGVEGLPPHTALRASTFFSSVLPQLGVSVDMNSNQPRLLKALLFGDASSADYETLVGRIVPAGEAQAAYHASETSTFLRTWAHLPPPVPKPDEEEENSTTTTTSTASSFGGARTALGALEVLQAHMNSRGIQPFLQSMGFASHDAPCTHAQFGVALQRLNLRLGSWEMRRLLAALDPANTGAVDYQQLFKLHEQPPHELAPHHAKHRELQRTIDARIAKQQHQKQKQAGGNHEESKEQTSSSSSSSSLSAPVVIPTLALPSQPALSSTYDCMPPLFQSVHSARTVRVQPIGGAASLSGSQSARPAAATEYSVAHPRPPPTRFQLTHHDLHTPLSAQGGFGRPLSAASRHRVDAQRAALHLPPVQTLPAYRADADSFARPSSIPHGSSSSSSSSSAFFASESERFLPREQALRALQDSDRLRRANKLAARAQSLDNSEARVLHAYESEALAKQRQVATSILDRVQQKRAHFAALEANYPQHAAGKRTHHTELYSPDQSQAALTLQRQQQDAAGTAELASS